MFISETVHDFDQDLEEVVQELNDEQAQSQDEIHDDLDQDLEDIVQEIHRETLQFQPDEKDLSDSNEESEADEVAVEDDIDLEEQVIFEDGEQGEAMEAPVQEAVLEVEEEQNELDQEEQIETEEEEQIKTNVEEPEIEPVDEQHRDIKSETEVETEAAAEEMNMETTVKEQPEPIVNEEQEALEEIQAEEQEALEEIQAEEQEVLEETQSIEQEALEEPQTEEHEALEETQAEEQEALEESEQEVLEETQADKQINVDEKQEIAHDTPENIEEEVEPYPHEESEPEVLAPEQLQPPSEPVTSEPEETNEKRILVTEEQLEKPEAKKKKPKLLNKLDKTIKVELDAAEKLRKKGKVQEALKAFEHLVAKFPQSPKARYGKAQSEDDLAEKMRSNEILLRAISTYGEVADLPNVPADLIKLTLKRRADRQQFLGRVRGSVVTLQKLVQLYPDEMSFRNDLGVGYLLIGDNKNAQGVFEEVLAIAPSNGFAKVHYGFILKAENKIVESIPYLKEGLESGEPGTDDGRFYFHLGDALQRAGSEEAYTWYEAGHKKGHFASVWQRSLYNVNGLKAQPWWTARETGYVNLVKILEANWKLIRDEGLGVMDKAKGLFVPEDENLREKGDWSQYTLWQQGRKNEKSCAAAPKTCALLDRFPESTGCRRGQIKFSVMHPGTHVWPHTGPTNCRLRMHLGLVVPTEGCRIRCANDTRTWEEGKVLIFDDSFEHEVWQEANSYRLIFIVDVWHPELTQHQRQTLPAI
ncbi:hypothetical protein GDO86_010979 [Hymenochirus boettgeri]|uniref:Aspartyl/asparaginy/proline hydroxylase domain-containing protein n=1 Tax=Hymenochirus boettgeri TaxID=247094 RepID=A0A8T2JHD4_9PIPI|nr:hypothetical protein GDO86_010979 [Hymenochirus boettgeri]